jgi:ribokinase
MLHVTSPSSSRSSTVTSRFDEGDEAPPRVAGQRGSSMMPNIVVVGSTMIDVLMYAERTPERGQTVVGQRMVLGHGGKGANQAAMAARLGARVTFVNRVGNDVFGEMTRANLADQGLDLSRVRAVANEATGVATIWVEPDGNNRILIVPGANGTLTAADVVDDLADVPPPDCVICQLEISPEAVKAALEWGRACGATTILNPAPAAPLSDDLLGLVDWLIPNESEFEDLFGAAPDDDNLLRASSEVPGGLVVTLGADGAVAVVKGGVARFAPPVVQAIDTTGAGDAFLGGLAYSLARGEPLPAAIAFANRCGALSTTKFGTRLSFPNLNEVLQERAQS